MRFSRFSDRACVPSFFTFASARFSSHFSKRCKNHAFSCVFRDLAATPVRTSGFRKLIFGIPELRCGLTGLTLGLPRLKTCSKPRVFTRFHDFRIKPTFVLFLFVYVRNVAKTTRFHTFFGPWGRGSMPLFSSLLLARSSKTCRKPLVLQRFWRFCDRAVVLVFFIHAFARFSPLSSKCGRNHAFSCVF